MTCPRCGEKGILDVIYDYERIKAHFNKDTLRKATDRTMWRFAPLMSVSDPPKTRLHVGGTPLYACTRLADTLGLRRLHIKDEGSEPSGSLKDRASAVACAQASAMKRRVLSCSSTGNAASSLAAQAARAGLESVIFVPARAPVGKLNQLAVHGATIVRVDGDYKAAFEMSKTAISKYGWYNRNAAINPHLVEGKKTVLFEIAEQSDFRLPDWIVVSVGDGCTIAGVHKGLKDLLALSMIDSMPRLLGVQSEGCAPFVEAWRTKSDLVEHEEDTLADSIAVGIPRNPRKGLEAVKQTDGAYVSVSDKSILEAMKTLGALEGIFAEPASAASLAGLTKALEDGIIRHDESVCLIHTGNGLKDPDNARKAVEEPPLIKPDERHVVEYLEKRGVI